MTLSLILGDELLPNIIGDRERLLQIITILTENAFRYAGENIPVEITADTDDKDVKISVIDHGAGLSSADAKHVFDRFYRCDKSRNDKKGFGLGLSIAKELVELHCGNIEYSPTDGGGCTFTVILYSFTTFCGFPFKNPARFSAAVFISLVRASRDAHAIWGVIKQFLADVRGLFFGGSTVRTSSPAA